MSFDRWTFRVAVAVVANAVLLLSSVGGTVAEKTGNIVVYWGQNGNEGTLRAACITPEFVEVAVADPEPVAQLYEIVEIPDQQVTESRNGGVTFLSDYSKKGKKKVWITAAPQCPFPDRLLGQALRTGLFDRVHVQFYNNPVCNYRANNVEAFTRAWNTWASSLPRSSIYLGLPAARQAAGGRQWVHPPKTLRSSNYGGIMLWSRFWDVKTGYSKDVKSAVLTAGNGGPDGSTDGGEANAAVI